MAELLLVRTSQTLKTGLFGLCKPQPLWQNRVNHDEVASMPSLVLDIALSAERFRAVYQGRANRVLLFSRDGRKVSLPAHHLRPFLRHDGIYGVFALEFSAAGELLELRQLQ